MHDASLACCRGLPNGLGHNPQFVGGCIEDTIAYAHNLIQRRTTNRSRPIGQARARSRCDLAREEVLYLGHRAFLEVLLLQGKGGMARLAGCVAGGGGEATLCLSPPSSVIWALTLVPFG
jgi:hypothetical protein